ncbi:MAG TPA: arylsulfotransferase family protein [Solirubrobacteraceae bacterium]|nr:arylsulfotransferase family protein [Solirubrobacteraceae bacterium]
MRVIVGLTTAFGLALATSVASASTAAPSCAPATLNSSAIKAGSVTVSPLSGSRDATPRTQISFLGVPPRSLARISVIGSLSGVHAGRLLAYSQGDGASFVPTEPFVEGERVVVRAELRSGASLRPLLDDFAIAEQDQITKTPEAIHPGQPSEVQGFRSRPDLHPPALTVTASSPSVAAGDEFVAPYTGPGQAGPMIVDPTGGLIWFKPLPTDAFATNFRVQEYLGKPVLTWWQGDISVHGYGLGEGVIADQSYAEIAHVRAGNGVEADLHELQLTPQGTALITAYEPIRCDLAVDGGTSASAVMDGLIQEVDVKTGLVMFQWTSLEHVPLSDSYSDPAHASNADPFDYFHVNSINVDSDGSLLISARNTWTAYDLDPLTGQIEWQLGGRRSSFTMQPGTRTAWQHDPRQLADGSFSIFDNGATPAIHAQSRGIVVSLDAQSRTATLSAQLEHTPPLLADSQGNMQALANGDWFVGWGQEPDFSEFDATGALLFDAHFPAHTQSYRDFRFAWTGLPSEPPVFALAPSPGGAATLYASWNGATLVAAWRVLSGASPTRLQLTAQAPRTGFETAIALRPGMLGRDVTVQAINAAGQVIGTARAAKA